MPIYKPKELLAFLDAVNAFPKKRLSQNFLIDGNIVRKIVDQAEIGPGDFVVEIGPGPGALTEALLATGAHVLAIEMDSTFAEHLHRFDPTGEKLEVICDDVLNVELPKKGRKVKLIGNLPYHITTPILVKFLSKNSNEIASLTFMVQDEVAERIVASPKTADYGSLTVFLNFYANVSYAFRVTKNCFYPAPTVDSAIISLIPKPIPPDVDVEKFFEITRKAFQMRRKTLKKSLKELYTDEQIQHALESNGLTMFTRPEELTTEQFIAVFKALQDT